MTEDAFFGEKHEDFPKEHTKKVCTYLQGVGDVKRLFEKACNKSINHECSENPPENESALRTVIRKTLEIFIHIISPFRVYVT